MLPWLQMMQSQSPGAHLMLVCTHAETPPPDLQGLSDWQGQVVTICDEVGTKVRSPPHCFVDSTVPNFLALLFSSATAHCE